MKATTEPQASLSLLWGTLGMCFLLITVSGINPSALLFLMVLLGACLFGLSYWFRNEPPTPRNPMSDYQPAKPLGTNDPSPAQTVLPSVTLSTDTRFFFR